MIVYGRNSVEEALAEGLKITEAFVEKEKRDKYQNLYNQVKAMGVPITLLDSRNMEKTTKTRKHQGFAVRLETPPNVLEQESDFDGNWSAFERIVVLDGITDTGNLGAIIRSAVLFGVDALVLPNDNSARITPQTIKTSAGAFYKQKIIYIDNINRFLATIKEKGFFVYSLAGDSKKSIDTLEFNNKACLVIGSEREGLRKSVRKISDELISIPTTRKLDSLNASVASAIAMWEVFRQNRNRE